MLEDREEYKTKSKDDKFVASFITFTITNNNKYRVHEIVGELLELRALNCEDAELLLSATEAL